MLILTRGVLNTWVVTLTEKVSIANPYYLLVLKGKANQPLIKKVMTDVSTYPSKYNKFTFTEGTDLTVPTAGDFTYTFYQVATNTTVVPSDANILETGICRVSSIGVTIISHTTPRNTVIHESE